MLNVDAVDVRVVAIARVELLKNMTRQQCLKPADYAPGN